LIKKVWGLLATGLVLLGREIVLYVVLKNIIKIYPASSFGVVG
jgi:hypothetical protein